MSEPDTNWGDGGRRWVQESRPSLRLVGRHPFGCLSPEATSLGGALQRNSTGVLPLSPPSSVAWLPPHSTCNIHIAVISLKTWLQYLILHLKKQLSHFLFFKIICAMAFRWVACMAANRNIPMGKKKTSPLSSVEDLKPWGWTFEITNQNIQFLGSAAED